MTIHVQVFDDDGRKRKDEEFRDPLDLIAWICRCYQATKRACATKIAKANAEKALERVWR